MARRPSSQDGRNIDLLLVAPPWHRSGCGNNPTCVESNNSIRADDLPHITSAEDRHCRGMCGQRTFAHMHISKALPRDQLIQIFRDTIQLTGTSMERPGPPTQHTHLPGIRSTVPHQVGVLPRSSTTHWQMGLRRHQAIHSRGASPTPTCGKPESTGTQ